MAKAREIPGLSAEEPYGSAASRILRVRTEELIEHSHDVLDLDDIERLHDMRVATRRLRAALEVFEPCFPSKPFRSALAKVKELADALGERRDRDVAIAALEQFAEALPAADRPGIESLVAGLRDEQAEANRELEPLVATERLGALGDRLAELAGPVDERSTDGDGSRPVDGAHSRAGVRDGNRARS